METYKLQLVAVGNRLELRNYEENYGGIISTEADHITGPLINDIVAVLNRHKGRTARVIDVTLEVKD